MKSRAGVAACVALAVAVGGAAGIGLWSCTPVGGGTSREDIAWAHRWAGCCGQRMVVEGDAHYFAMSDHQSATGAPIPPGYEAEIWGQSIVVKGQLRPGRYTVEVAGAENVFRDAGQRTFNISVDGKTVARDVDLFKRAGGSGKVATVTATVDHPGGEITIVLQGEKNFAKFSAIRILDAAGDKVAWALAVDLKDIEKVLNDRIPQVSGPVLWKDWRAPRKARVADLLRRMTLREKVAQMMNSAPAIKRLGLPSYDYWNECLHGVARNGIATVFPQAIGMAASWDTAEMHTVADIISTEARAKHDEALRNGDRSRYTGLTFWTPNINIFRDPRWGRGQETYGEDPFLTGKMAVSFITGLQGDDPHYFKVVATAKHYAVHSGPEALRHVFDAAPPEKDFYEEYLPQFEMAVRDAHVYSVMGAYNAVYGKPACASDLLLNDILRHQWGFNGYVVSDCGAITDIWFNHESEATRAAAAAAAVKAGCDLECGSDYSALASAVDMGLITEKEIDTALGRILMARFKLGMFDPPELVKYEGIPYSENDSPAHNAEALAMAEKSMVLLKNDGVLPLRKDLKKIAVVGPNADTLLPLLGNYNGVPSHPVQILQGIQNALPGTEVTYVRGCDIGVREDAPDLLPDVCVHFGGATGFRGEYFDNEDLSGTPVAVRQDKAIDFRGWMNQLLAGAPQKACSVRWTGDFVAPADGTYEIRADGQTPFKLSLNGKIVEDTWTGGLDPAANAEENCRLTLHKGDTVPIELVAHEGGGVMNIELTWTHPDNVDLNPLVLNDVKDADAIIFVGGIDPHLEQEEGNTRAPIQGFLRGDRTTIELPSPQTDLLKQLATLHKPLVFVNMSGSAIAMPWEAAHLPAILQAWYPGQMGGTAVANVLFGDYNPAGRLPVTFYRSTSDLGDFKDYNMSDGEGLTYRYFKGKPLWAFGHGLSYTNFSYAAASINHPTASPQDTVTLKVNVTNTGKRDGEEVVQVYGHPQHNLPGEPLQRLVSFQRVAIPAGKTLSVELPVHLQDLREWNDQTHAYEVPPGRYTLDVGRASDDVRTSVELQVR